MCNRIKIGLVFETMEEAKDFIETYAPTAMRKIYSKYELVYETPIMVFQWVKPFCDCRGQRLNFVFTTKLIRNTDWFDTCVRPAQWAGTSAIDE